MTPAIYAAQDLNDKVAKLAAHARMREAEGRVPQKIAVTDDAVG
jgi:hypothetical protein